MDNNHSPASSDPMSATTALPWSRWRNLMQQYGYSVLAIVMLAHLFSLYLALLQTPPDQPLQLHVDSAWWLSLQALLVIGILRQQLRHWPLLLSQAQHLPHPQAATQASSNSFTHIALGSIAAPPAWRSLHRHLWRPLSRSALWFVLSMLGLQLCIDVALQQPLDAHLLLRQALMLLLLFSLISAAYLVRQSWAWQQQQQWALHQAASAAQRYQLQLLQQQLDPHFLFNNLNVLSALIHKDADDAEAFLSQFSDVYRYQIQHSAQPLVPLSLEVAFAQTYMALLTQRFGDSIQLVMDPSLRSAVVATDNQQQPPYMPAPKQQETSCQKVMPAYQLVPCALQLLLENAVKHNQFSQTAPLQIHLQLKEQQLWVSHRHQPKPFAVPSTGLGLQNLDQRCWHILQQHIQAGLTAEGEFVVRVPLTSDLADLRFSE